jgi:hypothetical protein
VQLPICVDYNVNFDPLFVCPNAVTTRIADTPATPIIAPAINGITTRNRARIAELPTLCG